MLWLGILGGICALLGAYGLGLAHGINAGYDAGLAAAQEAMNATSETPAAPPRVVRGKIPTSMEELEANE